MSNHETTKVLRWTGILGITATAVFLAKTFIPMPSFPHLLLCMAFGPLVIAGSPGMARFLTLRGPSMLADAAARFAVIAGAFHLSMVCVQSTTLIIMRQRIAEAEPSARAAIRQILDGTFTVQLGLCFCWDLLIGVSTLLFCSILWRRGPLAAMLAISGALVAIIFLAMKLSTYPIPPAEAGLFDLGPGLGAWYLLFSIYILCNAKQPSKALAELAPDRSPA
ncbi:MAG: hypothetical protein JNM86_06845 [Phycisphaerae bacterium]|nr:hypothetical protein [Phycisphaerae bacterium]MBN8598340.1 hypothetical protein [Planctomycetota bacterium]